MVTNFSCLSGKQISLCMWYYFGQRTEVTSLTVIQAQHSSPSCSRTWNGLQIIAYKQLDIVHRTLYNHFNGLNCVRECSLAFLLTLRSTSFQTVNTVAILRYLLPTLRILNFKPCDMQYENHTTSYFKWYYRNLLSNWSWNNPRKTFLIFNLSSHREDIGTKIIKL